MNKARKILLVSAGAAFLLTLFFVRWEVIMSTGTVTGVQIGPVWSCPEYHKMALLPLVIEWVVIAVTTGVLWEVFRDRKPR
ncbi:MAG: hypothetical protein WC712_12870 [Candidatus Brocadiia bacterium]